MWALTLIWAMLHAYHCICNAVNKFGKLESLHHNNSLLGTLSGCLCIKGRVQRVNGYFIIVVAPLDTGTCLMQSLFNQQLITDDHNSISQARTWGKNLRKVICLQCLCVLHSPTAAKCDASELTGQIHSLLLPSAEEIPCIAYTRQVKKSTLHSQKGSVQKLKEVWYYWSSTFPVKCMETIDLQHPQTQYILLRGNQNRERMTGEK